MSNLVGRMGRLWHGYRVVVVVVLLFAVGLVAVLVFLNRDTAPSAVDSVLQRAQADSAKGRYEDAYSKLRAAENKPATNEEKAILYGQIAMAAANSGETRDAVAYLAKKHQVDPSAKESDALMLASLYETLGESDNALAQYKVALTFLERKAAEAVKTGELNETGNATIDSVKARIAELEAQQ